MSITFCYPREWKREAEFDTVDLLSEMKIVWLVKVDEPTYHPATLLQEARLAVTNGNLRVPDYGETFDYLGVSDANIYAMKFEVALVDPQDPYLWEVMVHFTSGFGESGKRKKRNSPINPLDEDPEYWLEWEEVEVPLEKASCLTNLPSIYRGPAWEPIHPTLGYNQQLVDNGFNIDITQPGPIVNAAGQQTVDPLTITVYRPILCCLKNEPNILASILLNAEYSNTVNAQMSEALSGTPDKGDETWNKDTLFLGDPPRTWRYLHSQADRREYRKVPPSIHPSGQVAYYPTTTKLAYNGDTWDRLVLNNGQTCFYPVYYKTGTTLRYTGVTDPRQPVLVYREIDNPSVSHSRSAFLALPAVVQQLKEDGYKPATKNNTGGVTDADDVKQPTEDDFEEVLASEPVNLDVYGFQIKDLTTPANHIRYRHYKEKDFNLITPFIPLVAEYKNYIELLNE